MTQTLPKGLQRQIETESQSKHGDLLLSAQASKIEMDLQREKRDRRSQFQHGHGTCENIGSSLHLQRHPVWLR